MTLGYFTSLGLSLLLSAACGSLLYACRHLPPGRSRLWPSALVIAADVAMPLLFDRATAYVSVCTAAFLITWLQGFKAAAWAGGRGSLVAQPWSWAQFVALYTLPLVPSDPKKSKAEAGGGKSEMAPPAVMVVRWALKTGLTAAMVFLLLLEPRSQVLKELMYVAAMYGMLGCFMDGPASLVLGGLGLSLEPHFRPPWEAQSIAQFWGRQWNQAASHALRTTIYEPIVEGSFVRTPAAKARAEAQARAGTLPPRMPLALCVACCASGVVHELIIYYVYRFFTGGSWMLFFTMQGPLILLERAALSALGRAGIKPPRPLKFTVTLVVLMFTAHHWFFGPAEDFGFVRDFSGAMRRNFAALVGQEAAA